MKLRKSLPNELQVDPTSRRMFLKTAGGATLAIPLLPTLLTSFSEKALAAGGTPQRYVSFLSGYGGLQHQNWGGTNLPQNPFNLYSGQVARQASIASLLQGNALSPVLDANYANLWSSANLIMGNDQPYYIGHNRGAVLGCFTTSIPGQQWVSDQGKFGNPRTFDVETPTVDQVLAYAGGAGIYGAGLGGRRRQLNVVAGFNPASWGRDDYTANDHVAPRDCIYSTSGIFSYLFGGAQAAQGGNPLLHLLNAFWPSGRQLIQRLSGDDRLSLEKFFSLAQDAANDYALPGPSTAGVTKPSGVTDQTIDSPADLQTLADLIGMAFKADVTRVVNISCSAVVNGYDFHAVSHSPNTGNNPSVNQGQPEMIQIHKNMSDNFFARLGNNLLAQDPFDSSNTILRNSLAIWTKESKCAHHNFSNPTLLLGEAGGRLATGNFTDLRNLNRSFGPDGVGDMMYGGDIMNRFWASIFYAMNIPRNQYEIRRGGVTPETVALSTGYGHIMTDGIAGYNLSKVGDPWEFLTKAGVPWG
jgi:hypothetical protein